MSRATIDLETEGRSTMPQGQPITFTRKLKLQWGDFLTNIQILILAIMTSWGVAAVLLQIGSFVTTYLFTRALVPVDSNPIGTFFLALAAEYCLTLIKKGGGIWGVVAIILDSIINGGGLFALVTNLDRTSVWEMFRQGAGATSVMGYGPAMWVAMGIGALLSASPVPMWKKAIDEI